MQFSVTRQIIRHAWRGTTDFDPWLFRRRLSLVRSRRVHYIIEKIAETPGEVIYEVEGAWLVFLDLSGPDAHYCTCLLCTWLLWLRRSPPGRRGR